MAADASVERVSLVLDAGAGGVCSVLALFLCLARLVLAECFEQEL
jgi:hypothetical protein